MNHHDIGAMVAAYIECAVWAGFDWSDETEDNPPTLESAGYGVDDITEDALADIFADVTAFVEANAVDLAGIDAGQAGHDFFLTRNGHGAGFWDRGLGAIGDRLTEAAHVYGESDLYVNDAGGLDIS
jgi:hypothetical protein